MSCAREKGYHAGGAGQAGRRYQAHRRRLGDDGRYPQKRDLYDALAKVFEVPTSYLASEEERVHIRCSGALWRKR